MKYSPKADIAKTKAEIARLRKVASVMARDSMQAALLDRANKLEESIKE
jgi:hypothetical protein